MSNKTKLVVSGIAAALLIAAAFLFLMPSSKKAAAVGNIAMATGEALLREVGSTTDTPFTAPRELLAQEVLSTGPDGQIQLEFLGGLQLLLEPNSRLVAEFDSASQQQINATVLAGSVKFLKKVKSNTVRVYKNGVELTGKTPEALTPLIISGADSAEPKDEAAISIAQSDEPSATSTPSMAKNEAESDDDTVLSNDEIQRTIISKRSLFQRCYLSYLQRTKDSTITGRMVIAFEIENDGHVLTQKLVSSPFQDNTLHSCILEVIARISFSPFEGSKIVVQEFPIDLK